jgi:hypothetical protein
MLGESEEEEVLVLMYGEIHSSVRLEMNGE